MNKISKDTFGTYHPILNFTYFCLVLFFGMVFLHPVMMGIAFAGAFSYSLFLNGKGALKFNLVFVLPMMAVSALVNPLFNHRGMTILTYFMDNPITAESIWYGIATGFMFGTVILWFSCYNAVITSDKFIYIFGKVIPVMSLVFAMILRFIPKFKAQIQVVSGGQRCIGRDVGSGTLIQRAGHGLKILSIMVTWALENGIDTADSMRARGYGLPGRTSYSIFRFDTRDKWMSLFGAGTLLLVGIPYLMGANGVQFFPVMKVSENTFAGSIQFFGYVLLCFGPLLIDAFDSIRWRRIENDKKGTGVL